LIQFGALLILTRFFSGSDHIVSSDKFEVYDHIALRTAEETVSSQDLLGADASSLTAEAFHESISFLESCLTHLSDEYATTIYE
jgi:hypothetical protein